MLSFFKFPKSTSQIELSEKLKCGDPIVLIDVRRDEEFGQGTIPGAKHIPLDGLENVIEGKVPNKNAHCVVFCRTQGRSPKAVRKMQKLGYKNVTYLSGGYSEWSANPDSN